MSIFDIFKKKEIIKGIDEKGNPFDIKITKGEAVSDDSFLELSNGRGEDDVE